MTVKDLINELQDLVLSGDVDIEAKIFIVHNDWPLKSVDFKDKDRIVIK